MQFHFLTLVMNLITCYGLKSIEETCYVLRNIPKTLLQKTCQMCTASRRFSTLQKQTQVRSRVRFHIFPCGRKPDVIMSNRLSSASPSIKITPADTATALVDEKVAVEVLGLKNKQSITIHACLKEEKFVFESCCCYCADVEGTLDVRRNPSLSGSYTGISDMGLFTSMVAASGQRPGLRLIKRDVSTPFVTELKVYNGHHNLETIHSGSQVPITSAVCHRWYQAPGVRRIPVKSGRICGVLFLPAGSGPFPGVIDMFGSAGGLIEFRSALLASRGFACLSLAFFNYEDLPSNLATVDFDYFMEAIDWFSSHEAVLEGGIGAIGVSKGGELVLLMAVYSPKFYLSDGFCQKLMKKPVINGCHFARPISLSTEPSGSVILRLDMAAIETGDHGAVILTEALHHKEEDIFHLWKSDAKILMLAGDDDKCCSPLSLIQAREMYPEERRDDCRLIIYPSAGHLIEPPYTPLCRMSYHKAFDINFMWGGLPEAHAAAQEDSWHRILHHFRANLPQPQKYSPATGKL